MKPETPNQIGTPRHSVVGGCQLVQKRINHNAAAAKYRLSHREEIRFRDRTVNLTPEQLARRHINMKKANAKTIAKRKAKRLAREECIPKTYEEFEASIWEPGHSDESYAYTRVFFDKTDDKFKRTVPRWQVYIYKNTICSPIFKKFIALPDDVVFKGQENIITDERILQAESENQKFAITKTAMDFDQYAKLIKQYYEDTRQGKVHRLNKNISILLECRSIGLEEYKEKVERKKQYGKTKRNELLEAMMIANNKGDEPDWLVAMENEAQKEGIIKKDD